MNCSAWLASFTIAHFLEATSHVEDGPYDVVLVEGSITTPGDAARIQRGAATSQIPGHDRRLHYSRRHPIAAELGRLRRVHAGCLCAARLYSNAGHVDAHCRPREGRLWSCAAARSTSTNCSKCSGPCWPAAGRERPSIVSASTASGAERSASWWPRGLPCLGPVTQSGCGALCPVVRSRLFGCYGPAAQPNLVSLTGQFAAMVSRPTQSSAALRSFNGYAPEFRGEGDRLATAIRPRT